MVQQRTGHVQIKDDMFNTYGCFGVVVLKTVSVYGIYKHVGEVNRLTDNALTLYVGFIVIFKAITFLSRINFSNCSYY